MLELKIEITLPLGDDMLEAGPLLAGARDSIHRIKADLSALADVVISHSVREVQAPRNHRGPDQAPRKRRAPPTQEDHAPVLASVEPEPGWPASAD
ncbi:MAG: hypothetical protein KGL35_30485 [Bradyrhizobium sp.]|nr:hypothetical protein [Bradyrhizobium sp.]